MKRARKVKWPEGERLIFFCPGCKDEHSVPLNKGWTFTGDMTHPTLSPSVHLFIKGNDNIKSYVCHFFLVSGELQYLDDCTHKYAGKTLGLPFKYRNNE